MKKNSKPNGAENPLLKAPAKFRSYEDEAKWYDDHIDEITQHVLKHGKLVGPRIVEKTRSITLRIPESDLKRAKSIAETTGKPYQRVLKDAMRAGLKRAG